MALLRRTLLSALAVVLPLLSIPASAADGVTVFAAASLKGSLDTVAEAFTAGTGTSVTVSYAAASALAKQIEQGAPADLFISADIAWMDYVATRDLIQPETRTNLLTNALVFVAEKDSPITLTIAPGFDLASALGGGRLAVGAVTSVPAGKYAKAALETLGAWDGVAGSLAEAENVRAALQLVARGEAPLGIVYRTDAAAEPAVKVVATFPEDSHPPIVYPVAVLKEAPSPAAGAFLTYLKGAAAGAVFETAGFGLAAH